MIRSRYVLVSLLVVLTLTTAAKAVDKEKLRRAVSLPQITVIIGYGVNGRGEFMNNAEAIPDPEKIAEMERELKGDATDAERYRRLANLYSRAGQPTKRKEARLKAIALFRKQLEQHPDDAAILWRLADALDDAEKSEEAETLARRVVKDHPNDWHAWLVLGVILDGKCSRAIKGVKSFNSASPEALLQSMRAAKLTPERIAASQQYRQEAVACFDRAVSLAPGEAEVYLRRGASRYHYGFLEYGLRLYKGEKADFFEYGMGKEALPDLRRAIDLNRQEYKVIGMVVFFETMTEARDYPEQNPSSRQPKRLVDALSESTRKHVLEDMACLEKGAQTPDNNKAAEAAEVLGYLQLFLFADESSADYVSAEKSARRSIELDPKREAAWDLLCACLAEAQNYRELTAVCRERLAHKDSARNRLMLAKGYEHLDQLDKAEEVVRAGLQRKPDDFMLRLTLADLLLMRGDKESLHQAGRTLAKLRNEKLSDGGSDNRWSNYTFASGIYYGLIGEREKAQKWLKQVQKHQPEYDGIEDALKALEK